jgi:uncharacterized membrane protein YqjE
MNADESRTGSEDAHGAAPEPAADPGPEQHPARQISLHLLRMLETRMEAAGIALQGETQLLMARLQLKLLVAAGIFFAIWGGIVLLAIALPEELRVPVLGAVVGGFVLLALVAHLIAKRKESSREVGSIRWFLDSLRQDLELLSRSLSGQQAQPKPGMDRSPPRDLAA